ncbi:hypothetical protein ACP70R_045052 [Stipagrostis hirtigluma subsp. patula]
MGKVPSPCADPSEGIGFYCKICKTGGNYEFNDIMRHNSEWCAAASTRNRITEEKDQKKQTRGGSSGASSSASGSSSDGKDGKGKGKSKEDTK